MASSNECERGSVRDAFLESQVVDITSPGGGSIVFPFCRRLENFKSVEWRKVLF